VPPYKLAGEELMVTVWHPLARVIPYTDTWPLRGALIRMQLSSSSAYWAVEQFRQLHDELKRLPVHLSKTESEPEVEAQVC
jgi:hypothetical protein